MGKKKDKARRKHAEHRRDEMRFAVPPHVAGIAAAAIEQVNTPAFRRMIAGALGAAAHAFDQRRSERPPSGPSPSPTPQAGPASPRLDDAPRFDRPEIRLSPEAARAIDQATTQATRAVEGAATLAARAVETAAAAMERWAASQSRAARSGDGHGDASPRAPDRG